MTQVWDDSPYDGTRLLIHLALADMAHDDGRFFASQAHLAEKARCSTEHVRKTIRDMEARGLVAILEKGSSRGRATVYQLCRSQVEPPNTVGESQVTPTGVGTGELPNTVGDNSPNLTGQLPNSAPNHSSYTLVLETTTASADADARPIGAGEAAARAWWLRQNPRPIGKRSWHALRSVTEAAQERGYDQPQIERALDAIGVVPSMQQMDRALRGVTPQRPSATRMYLDAASSLQSQQAQSAAQSLKELTG